MQVRESVAPFAGALVARLAAVVKPAAACAVIAAATAGAASAQQPVRPAASTGANPPAAEEPELRFEREIFVYPIERRRDPFVSLAKDTHGPEFEDLSLGGIMYSPNGNSVVLLRDRDGRIYRVRRGEVVGNARVVNITPTRVTFAVEMLGVVRQEQLELKRKNEGVDG